MVREVCVSFSTYLSTGTMASPVHIMRGFPSAFKTAEVMPKVWIDLEQSYKAYNQPVWAGVGIWRCEEVWCG